MVFPVDPLELGLIDVGVDLGGGHVGVSKKFLDDPKVRSTGQQMRGKAVPQGMW